MRKTKIYLDETLFYRDRYNSDAFHNIKTLFRRIEHGGYNAFTSQFVIDMISRIREPNESKELDDILKNITILDTNDESNRLVELYYMGAYFDLNNRNNEFLKYFNECGFCTFYDMNRQYDYDKDSYMNIAIASVNELDIVLSMDFRKLVNHKTRMWTGIINEINGYRSIKICSPMEVIKE